MFNKMAARVLLMVVDEKISVMESLAWVLRKMPKHLRPGMKRHLYFEVQSVMHTGESFNR